MRSRTLFVVRNIKRHLLGFRDSPGMGAPKYFPKHQVPSSTQSQDLMHPKICRSGACRERRGPDSIVLWSIYRAESAFWWSLPCSLTVWYNTHEASCRNWISQSQTGLQYLYRWLATYHGNINSSEATYMGWNMLSLPAMWKVWASGRAGWCILYVCL